VKVVHVEGGRHLYGGALQVLFLLDGLAARGIDNLLVCPRGSDIARAAREHGLRVVEMTMHGDADALLSWRLARLLRAESPDLVHLHSRRGVDVWGGIAAKLARVPAVLSRRVDNPESPWLARIRYRLFDRVVTISEGIRRVLIAEGVEQRRLICVPSAVDTLQYRRERDTEWFRQAFDIGAGQPVLGMIAQLIPRKGHRVALDALHELRDRQPDVRLILFGRGPEEAELRQRVRELRLDANVTFAGFRDDLPRVLPNLDVVVHPASMEGLGVSLLQAAACEVPVVATPVGGIPEIVVDGETGRLVPVGDAAALADVLGRLLVDPEERQRLGRGGRRRAVDRFSMNAMVEGNLEVYEGVLSGRRRQP